MSIFNWGKKPKEGSLEWEKEQEAQFNSGNHILQKVQRVFIDGNVTGAEVIATLVGLYADFMMKHLGRSKADAIDIMSHGLDIYAHTHEQDEETIQ